MREVWDAAAFGICVLRSINVSFSERQFLSVPTNIFIYVSALYVCTYLFAIFSLFMFCVCFVCVRACVHTCMCILCCLTYLSALTYSSSIGTQGTLPNQTPIWMSLNCRPRFSPRIVTLVPPWRGPVSGNNWTNKRVEESVFFHHSDQCIQANVHIKLSKHTHIHSN